MPELMKGHVWHKRKHLVEYPVLAEVKYDEIRCHVRVQCTARGVPIEQVEFLSYSGKPLANMQEFSGTFAALAYQSGYFEFDCGFEVNGNFNDSYRWVRSTKNFPQDLISAKTKFILFDLPNNPDPYILRKGRINHVAKLGSLSVAESTICLAEADVDAAFMKAREGGFEGLMVKSAKHTYQRGKRIDGWLKMKPEDDADGTIKGLTEAVSEAGVPLGRVGSVLIECADGSNASPHGIAHELGRNMFQNPEKYLGQFCEFKFMQRDRQGGYRHPTFHRLREQ